MGLEKLTIQIESAGSQDTSLQFDGPTADTAIVALFNPDKLVLSRSVSWPSQQAAKRDCAESQFTGGIPATLGVDLLFDTYDNDTPLAQKKSVRDVYVNKLLKLTTVAGHGKIHRPPVCRLSWGVQAVFFQGVLEHIETQYTMFLESGMPVRATNRCSFKQWMSNAKDFQLQGLMSADVAKVWTVKRGETLAGIAAIEYGDSRQWRFIAESNDLDDPLSLAPGMRLLLPARKPEWHREAT